MRQSDKCAYFRDINGIAAAFQYLQKNYSPAAMLFHWISGMVHHMR
jgi:hypothetical protein